MAEGRKKPGPKPGPRDKKAARTVAGLLMLGATQKEAAEAAGVSERVIRDWIHAPWWPDFRAQALEAIDEKLLVYSQRALLQAVREGDANIALKLVESLRPETYGRGGVRVTASRSSASDDDESPDANVVVVEITRP